MPSATLQPVAHSRMIATYPCHALCPLLPALPGWFLFPATAQLTLYLGHLSRIMSCSAGTRATPSAATQRP